MPTTPDAIAADIAEAATAGFRGNLIARGQAVIAHKGEWVRYSTPHAEGAEYIAICLPAFSMEAVHRDSSDGESR